MTTTSVLLTRIKELEEELEEAKSNALEPIDSMKVCCTICGDDRPLGPLTLEQCANGAIHAYSQTLIELNAVKRERDAAVSKLSRLKRFVWRIYVGEGCRSKEFETSKEAWEALPGYSRLFDSPLRVMKIRKYRKAK